MSKIDVKIDQRGLNKIIRNINRYKKGVKAEMQKEIQYTALEIERDAKMNAPVDTGRLRSSGNSRFKRNRLGAVISFPVHYAPHLEFGTKKMPAQPFLMPAYEKNTRDMKPRILEIIKGKRRRWF